MLHRKLKATSVSLQIISHLILGRERVAAAGESEAGQSGVPCRGEQAKRIPPLTPGIAGALVRVDDQERETAFGQIVSDGEPRLPASDDQSMRACYRLLRIHRSQNRADRVRFASDEMRIFPVARNG